MNEFYNELKAECKRLRQQHNIPDDEYFPEELNINDKMILNYGLVLHIAYKLSNDYHNVNDLFSEGMLELRNAIINYKEGRGKFCAFAGKCIYRNMLRYIKKTNMNSKVVYIDDQIYEDKEGNIVAYIDTLSNNEDTFEIVRMCQDVDMALSCFKCLNLKEKIIISEYLELAPKKTQKQLASELGFSQGEISRTKRAAILKLRKEFKSAELHNAYLMRNGNKVGNIINKKDEKKKTPKQIFTEQCSLRGKSIEDIHTLAENLLSYKNLIILENHLGLNNNEEKSNKEIGEMLNISNTNVASSICQIKKRIIKEIDKSINSVEVNSKLVNSNDKFENINNQKVKEEFEF